MTKSVIGREAAKSILENAKTSRKPELIAVIGRRRIGKTFLVNKTYERHIDFALTGLQNGQLSDQIQNFQLALARYFPEYVVESEPKNWLAVFHELTKAIDKHPKKGKHIIFFDELPWLATKRSKFLMAFGWFWNSWAISKNIVVVICGSAASWMIDKVIDHKGGLHNRVTQRIFLDPFTLHETAEFLKNKKIRLNQYQITQIYMAMGGVPMYLEQIQAGKSAVENIKEICFKREGYLWNEYPRLFSSLFNNHEKHEEIVELLASRKKGMTRNEIIAGTSFKNGGMLSKILNELDQSGFIDIYANYKKSKRDRIYRLTDPYSLFYLHFIKPLIASAQIQFSSLADLPKWRIWSGYAFENICISHIDQIRQGLGISGMQTTISTFNSTPKDDLPGTQIDLIIDRNDQSIHVCEIKFYTEQFRLTKKDVHNIETKKTVFRHHTGTRKHLFTTMITTFGALENEHFVNYVDQSLTMNDLFQKTL